MNLINEEHLTRLQIRDDGSQITGAFDHGASGDTQRSSHLARDHMGQRGLAQPRGTVEEHMVEGLAAFTRRLYEHPQVVAEPTLADELAQIRGTEALFEAALGLEGLRCEHVIVLRHAKPPGSDPR